MKTTTLSLIISEDYQNEFVSIHPTECELSFELRDGKHQVKTALMNIGTLTYLNNSTLQAQLSFLYEFDEENKVLTICGEDYFSKDAMCLTTSPEGLDETCHQQTFQSIKGDGSLMYNPNWNHDTQMTPGLQESFVEVVKKAINTLIDTTKKIEGLTLHIRKSPPILSSEEYANLLQLHKGTELVGFYESDKGLEEGETIRTIESTFGGLALFDYMENFANVIGSTGDPYPLGYRTWIGLYVGETGIDPTICTSYHYNGFDCSSNLVGGHIIKGTVAAPVTYGSNDVYILPICGNHNHYTFTGAMAAINYQTAVWLTNYHN